MITMLIFQVAVLKAQVMAIEPEPVTVVPYPQEVTLEKGVYSVKDAVVNLRFSGLEGNTLEIMGTQLEEAYKERFRRAR